MSKIMPAGLRLEFGCVWLRAAYPASGVWVWRLFGGGTWKGAGACRGLCWSGRKGMQQPRQRIPRRPRGSGSRDGPELSCEKSEA
jgi:hypothetical protein